MLFVVVVALKCVRDDDCVGARMLSVNDVRRGGGVGAGTNCCAIGFRRLLLLFFDVLLRALFLAISYFKRNGQSVAFALWLCDMLLLLQLKHVNVVLVSLVLLNGQSFVRCACAHSIQTVKRLHDEIP